jgi:arylsulfatase A-like enzyme
MAQVLDWMERQTDQPYLLFVHTYLVHGYFPQQRFLDRVAPQSGIDLAQLRITELWERAEAGEATAAQTLRTLYAATVAQADELVVGPLLGAVAEREASGGATLVALVSDHGEQFLEHEHVKHCLGSLHDEVIRTPFMIRRVGRDHGRRIASPVANLDLVPTLLELARVDAGDVPLRGRSLAPLLEADAEVPEPRSRYVFSAQGTKRCATDGRFKVMLDFASPERYLYDLSADPEEKRNLIGSAPEEEARLLNALGRWIHDVEGPSAEKRGVRSARAVEERLRAIGYLP